jgi:uncharacterized membrane protein
VIVPPRVLADDALSMDLGRIRVLNWLRWGGLAVVFAWFFVGGITHFTNASFFLTIMPPYVPFHLAIVYLSGGLEILFALGLLLPASRPWSGVLLILLTLAVTPANVHMWLNPEQFPGVSETALALRLVVQVLLIALIWWSTGAGRIRARAHLSKTRKIAAGHR